MSEHNSDVDLDDLLEDALEKFEEEERLEEEEKKNKPEILNEAVNPIPELNNRNNNNNPSFGADPMNENPEKLMENIFNSMFGGEQKESMEEFMNILKEVAENPDSKLPSNPFINPEGKMDPQSFEKEFTAVMDEISKNPGEFQNALGDIVTQILSKDVLGETMDEVAKNMPKWLEEQKPNLSEEKYNNHTKQLEVVKKIQVLLSQDSSSTQRDEILNLMEEVNNIFPILERNKNLSPFPTQNTEFDSFILMENSLKELPKTINFLPKWEIQTIV